MFLSFYFLIDLFLSSFCFQSMIGHCLGAAGGLEAIARARLKVENAEIVANGRWEWRRNIFLFPFRYAFTDQNPIFPPESNISPIPWLVEPAYGSFGFFGWTPIRPVLSQLTDTRFSRLKNRISVQFSVFPIRPLGLVQISKPCVDVDSFKSTKYCIRTGLQMQRELLWFKVGVCTISISFFWLHLSIYVHLENCRRQKRLCHLHTWTWIEQRNIKSRERRWKVDEGYSKLLRDHGNINYDCGFRYSFHCIGL